MRRNCNATPRATSLGRAITRAKSSGVNVSPIPNMTTPSSGTIAGSNGAKNAGAA